MLAFTLVAGVVYSRPRGRLAMRRVNRREEGEWCDRRVLLCWGAEVRPGSGALAAETRPGRGALGAEVCPGKGALGRLARAPCFA
ncbi:hypothetical protein NDU88_005028 [Pleurodeles waltl]|uniref:Uncharacterized protein n=1 Tax=Pleurodeles waltl TaxID=8319 RepID=A0AAV7QH64_PLEWA|nr:hypothetical protein NDU88_005028 [Pleurodeles waltl]